MSPLPRRILLLYSAHEGRIPSPPGVGLPWNEYGTGLFGELTGVLATSPHHWDVSFDPDLAHWEAHPLPWDGILSNIHPKTDGERQALRKIRRRIPWVSVGSGFYDDKSNRVGLSESHVMEKTVSHLTALGIRHIGWASLSPPGKRQEAWARAMAERGLPREKDFVFQPSAADLVRIPKAALRSRLKSFLAHALENKPHPLGGIVAYNDVVARHIQAWAADTGRPIPGDFSLVGVDGREDVEGIPRLTTLRFDGHAVARAALSLLEEMISGTRRHEGQVVYLPGKLRRGDTTAPRSDPANRKRKEFLEGVAAILDRHLDSPDPAAAIATALGMGRIHFNRMVAKHLGKPFRLRLMERRMERAAHLLRTTGLAVFRIARECGYESDASFHRHFRGWAKATPGEIRAEAGGRHPSHPPKPH